jgi:hypothetical protein
VKASPGLVTGLRRLRPATAVVAAPAEAQCELCPISIPEEHKHLLHLDERRIVCVCGTCWALRSGDAEFRPVGNRTQRLDDFALSGEQWAAFQLPIGLAFLMISSVTGTVIALYPSPAGATESELEMEAWAEVCAANPALQLEPDTEALIVNRLADPPQFAIAPIDRCYMLVGLIKANWDGISGGPRVPVVVREFFDGLRAQAIAA